MTTRGPARESWFSGLNWWSVLRAVDEKRKSLDPTPKSSEPSTAAASSSNEKTPFKKPAKPVDSFRETIESVVIAFVLAFLFRTFLAEAFVIPTGSMAPTLMGRHKDHRCQQCGHHYTLGASDEVEKDSNVLIGRVTTSVCSNCFFTNDVYSEPVFNGDRILVNKFPYEIGEPDRFDVFVFRYPEDPQTNYIKRLVALPGESLKIEGGDLYARKGLQGEYQILRKSDPNKQRLLQQTVYDDQHPPAALLKQGWPERWASMNPNPATAPSDDSASPPEWSLSDAGWTRDSEKRSYQAKADADWTWLRYRHLVPSDKDWERVDQNVPTTTEPKPQLIADFCGYNSHRAKHVDPRQQWEPDLFWTGDLTVNGQIDVRQVSGEAPAVVLELVEGIRRYRCEFDLKSGTATLSRTDELKGDGSFSTMATVNDVWLGAGRHHVSFANVDDRLCVWFDHRLLPFGSEAEYAPASIRDPQTADLHPVGIAVRQVEAEVSQLLIQRDIYYRAMKSPGVYDAEGSVGHQLAHVLTDPAEYRRIYHQETRSVEFDPLDNDEYFAMGDNSSHSYDGRLWHDTPQSHHAHAVNQRSLIGKAFFVYWPHGIPFLNHGKGFSVVPHGVRRNSPVEAENYPLYTAPFYPQWWRWSRIR